MFDLVPAFRALALSALFASAVTSRTSAQARLRNDIVTGRVTTEASQPLPGADVVITLAPSAATIRTKSDSSGNYRIAITNGTGEYVLFVGTIGRTPFRKRLTAAGNDTTFTVDARLPLLVQSLAAVSVQAKRVRPARALGSDGPVGNDATDKTADGVDGALPPDLQSNFEARASNIPGLTVTANGISAFGLGSDANSTKLNGLDFGGADLPRDARFTVRFRTSPWDPTSGGYAGVQTSISLAPGGNIASRQGHVTLDGPALQSTSNTSRQLGQSYTSLALDEGGVGAYALDKLFYDFGVHVGRRVSSGVSLADRDPVVLNALGVSPDSAARIVSALGANGIPIRTANQPTRKTTTDVSFLERIDRAPAPAIGDGPPGSTLAMTVYGHYSQLDANALTPTVTPAFTARSTNALGLIQGLHSAFVGPNGSVITETTSGLSIGNVQSTPYLSLPSASVTVVSDSAVGLVTAGGNGFAESDRRTWSWETINRTGWQVHGKESLPVSIYLQSRFDGFEDSPATNRYGRFGYASADAFSSNRPTSFSRTLNISDRRGGQWVGASAIGGDWIANTLKLTGGVRLDANAFTTAPAENDDVHRLFGVNTHTAPNGVSLSPRLGFVWRYRAATGYSAISSGASTIYRGPSQFRGGIGKFQATLPSTLLSDAIAQTGAPGGARQLLCVGDAVPTPDWRAYAVDASSIPASCVGGATNFADTSRIVSTFAPGFRAPESWRGNLGWTSRQFMDSYIALDATYSRTSHLASTLDLNFSGDPRFGLSQEDNRPVFVDAQNIVATSGAMTTSDSRRFAQFGRVGQRLSDLHSDTRQLSVYMMPNLPVLMGILSGSYTYTDSRTQTRGFDLSTGGDPRTVDWSRSAFAPKHTFMAQSAVNVFRDPHGRLRTAARDVGVCVHAAHLGRREWRRRFQRPCIRLRSVDRDGAERDARDREAVEQRTESRARLPHATDRNDRRREQLRRPVDLDAQRERDVLSLAEVLDGNDQHQLRQHHRRVGSAAARRRSLARVGHPGVARSSALAGARLRSGDESIRLRRESTLRVDIGRECRATQPVSRDDRYAVHARPSNGRAVRRAEPARATEPSRYACDRGHHQGALSPDCRH